MKKRRNWHEIMKLERESNFFLLLICHLIRPWRSCQRCLRFLKQCWLNRGGLSSSLFPGSIIREVFGGEVPYRLIQFPQSALQGAVRCFKSSGIASNRRNTPPWVCSRNLASGKIGTTPLEDEVVIIGSFSLFSQRFRHPFTAFVMAEEMASPPLPDE